MTKIIKKVDNLCLNGNIKCTNWLIRNDKLWIHNNRTCNTNTLALSAGELMWVAACMLTHKTNEF